MQWSKICITPHAVILEEFAVAHIDQATWFQCPLFTERIPLAHEAAVVIVGSQIEQRAGRRICSGSDKLATLLDDFQISHISDSIGMSLSGGERRRVEIARALAMEPAFILLDEPFAGVDPISVQDIKRIISQLANRGIGVLITDHNVRETLDICDVAYIVDEGAIIFQGETDSVLANEHVRQVYLGNEFRM